MIEMKTVNQIMDKIGDRPFALISINGPKRTGKSFALNYFVRYLTSNGHEDWFDGPIDASFHWRSGAERNTVGINIWSEPFIITDANGREVALLLMDTQGQFDDVSTMSENATIFAISTLLSSVLIFNIMRDFGEDILQFLQFFSGFALMVASQADEDIDAEAFQKLIFLLRDFPHPEYEYGFYDDRTTPSGQLVNFKKERLDTKVDQPEEVKFTHRQVLSSFSEVGVYAMPDPGSDLKRKDQTSTLDNDFKIHMKAFVELLLAKDNIVTKKVGGIEVTGTQFKKYIQGWSKLFGGGDLPEIKNVFMTAAETQNMIAVSAAHKDYNDRMKKFLNSNPDGVGLDNFGQEHSAAVIQALKVFKGMRKLGGKELEGKYSEEILAELEKRGEQHNVWNANLLRLSEMKKEQKREMEEMKKAIEAKGASDEEKVLLMEKLLAEQKLMREKAEEEAKAQRRTTQDITGNTILLKLVEVSPELVKTVSKTYLKSKSKDT